MRQVRHSKRARHDLIKIWVDIALENPDAADRVYDRVEARVRIRECFPEAGPVRPDIAASAAGVRAAILGLKLVQQGLRVVS